MEIRRGWQAALNEFMASLIGVPLFPILHVKTCSIVLLCLPLLLPLGLIDSNISIKTTTRPEVSAQTINPYNPYYNPYNTYRNPFFLANPTTLALSTAVNAPLVPPFELQQQISPWFPSIPAIACGAGLFSFTITGVPDKDVNIPLTHDKNKGGDDEEKNLVALQVIRDNDRFRILDDDVQGQITVGEKNIERQKWKDFEVEDLFNTCRTLAYSSSPDVDKNIKTPLPTLALSDDGVPITPLTASANTGNYPYHSSSTTGYPYTYPSTPGQSCDFSYSGVCIRSFPPDLDCRDVFPSANFRVLPPDPHDLDRDGDGIGCDLQDGA